MALMPPKKPRHPLFLPVLLRRILATVMLISMYGGLSALALVNLPMFLRFMTVPALPAWFLIAALTFHCVMMIMDFGTSIAFLLVLISLYPLAKTEVIFYLWPTMPVPNWYGISGILVLLLFMTLDQWIIRVWKIRWTLE